MRDHEQEPAIPMEELESNEQGPANDAEPGEGQSQLPDLAAGADQWKSGGGGGCQTWGCVVGIVLLLPLMVVGYYSMKQSVWMGFDKRCEKVLSRLSPEVSDRDREHLEASLDRLSRELHSISDPYPLMGEFSNRAAGAIADTRVNARDARKLAAWVDAVLDGEIEITEDPPPP